MTIEYAQKNDSEETIQITIHKMFTPEYCFEGDEITQHYFLKPHGLCMCGKVNWVFVLNEIRQVIRNGI